MRKRTMPTGAPSVLEGVKQACGGSEPMAYWIIWKYAPDLLSEPCKYNEGYLIGEWVELPVSDEELEKVLERIEIGGMYEETFITDYETDVDGVEVHEFDSIEELNELAETLESLDKYDLEVVEAMLSEGYTLEDALEQKDDCIVWSDCDDMEDVARAYCEECGILDKIPDNLQCYFDFEAFGRDMSFEGQYVFTSSGNCVQIL